jgi:hypothetical protein
MISKPCDITDFMICSPISCHLRGGMARVGGASFQPLHLLWPHHRQRAGRSVGTVVQLNGDGLDPAHVLVAVAAAKFQVSGGNFQVGRNFKFELMNCCPSLAHMQLFSPSWPLGSCRLAALCSGLGH